MGLITRPHAFTQAKFFSQYLQQLAVPDDDNSSSSACTIFTNHSTIKLQTRFFLLSTNNQLTNLEHKIPTHTTTTARNSYLKKIASKKIAT
jgi:hypothetical protein